MEIASHVHRFLTEIYYAESEAQALDSLSKLASGFGLEGAAFVLMPRMRNLDGSIPEPLVAIGNVPVKDPDAVKGWSVEYRKSNLFLYDPVYLVCLHTALPFSWIFGLNSIQVISSDTRFTAVHLAGARKCTKQTGIRAGITAPIRLPTGEFGYVSLLTTNPNWFNDEDAELIIDQLLIVGYRFHDAVKRLLPPAGRSDVPLSGRELHCLQLTAIGKSTQDTADLLGISYSTVRFHLQNAERKLGVSTRLNAVAKAASLGLIRTES